MKWSKINSFVVSCGHWRAWEHLMSHWAFFPAWARLQVWTFKATSWTPTVLSQLSAHDPIIHMPQPSHSRLLHSPLQLGSPTLCHSLPRSCWNLLSYPTNRKFGDLMGLHWKLDIFSFIYTFPSPAPRIGFFHPFTWSWETEVLTPSPQLRANVLQWVFCCLRIAHWPGRKMISPI